MAPVYAVLRTAHETFRLANVQQNVALASRDLGNFASALALWDEALASLGPATTPRERTLEAMIRGNQALTYQWQGDLEAAFTLHREARTLFEELGELGHAALVDLKLSGIEQERGHLAEALRLSALAADDLRRRGQRNAAAHAQLYQAKILLQLNRFEEAVD